jgi:acyl carrier protein
LEEADLQIELEGLDPTESLISGGIIDSIGILKLVGFIEEQWDVQLGPEEISLENFDTLNSIVKLIQTHLS